jgi:hypothetical protein
MKLSRLTLQTTRLRASRNDGAPAAPQGAAGEELRAKPTEFPPCCSAPASFPASLSVGIKV